VKKTIATGGVIARSSHSSESALNQHDTPGIDRAATNAERPCGRNRIRAGRLTDQRVEGSS
jgi:hypothetical protein